MNDDESITISSGLGNQEGPGSQHTSRREGVRGLREPAPTPIPHGHWEGDGLHGTMLGCVLTAPGNGV